MQITAIAAMIAIGRTEKQKKFPRERNKKLENEINEERNEKEFEWEEDFAITKENKIK